MSPIAILLTCLAAAQGPVLGIDGTHFTLDGAPTFLLGISYYGALAIEDEAVITEDLDTMKDHGFNWIRVWATWSAYDNNFCAVNRDGTPHGSYLDRLTRLCTLAGQRGMIVDVTLHRGTQEGVPHNFEEHLTVIEASARALKPFRNVYIDVGNERNIGDARHVPMDEVAALIDRVKAIDPARLCTASQGGDIGDGDAADYLSEGHVDFLTPHRGRHADSPSETGARTTKLLKAAAAIRAVPVHHQEPFRRGYADWQPDAKDFQADLEGAQAAGAAGWCFHNGGTRTTEDERPRRSFDLRPEEGRLFEQLDAEERTFMLWLREARLHEALD
jgi:hypothetical protein